MNAKPILIAEDSDDDIVFVKRACRGGRVVNPLQIVTDGEQAICYLKGEGKYSDREKFPCPVVLFLDLKLPRISGYEILAFLQSSPEHRNLPVIVLSVISDWKLVALAYEKGANSFLVKPVGISDLMNTLRGVKHLTLRSVTDGDCIEAD
ncbi:MAG: response regulator [Verrucomicrobiota bacterium]